MVGGGRNAFIGAVHRLAMRLDDQIALVAGALSSDPENAAASAAEIGLAPDRCYADYRDMARAEAARPDGIEAVVIVTPNHLHAPVATAFLEAGIDVICDKPLSTTLAEAEALVALAARTQAQIRRDAQQHRLRHGAAGARDGRGRRARTHRRRPRRLHPGLADAADRRRRPEAGRMAHRSGARRPIGGARRHRRPCLQPRLLRLGPRGRGRSRPICSPPCPDGGSTTMRMCWCAGRAARAARSWQARPRPATTTTCRVRIYGDKAGLEWSAARPEELRFSRYGEETPHPGARRPRRRPRRAAASRACRPAHPEGYIEAFANLYRDAADLIRAHRTGAAVDPAQRGAGARHHRRRARREVRGGGGGVAGQGRGVGAGGVWVRACASCQQAAVELWRVSCRIRAAPHLPAGIFSRERGRRTPAPIAGAKLPFSPFTRRAAEGRMKGQREAPKEDHCSRGIDLGTLGTPRRVQPSHRRLLDFLNRLGLTLWPRRPAPPAASSPARRPSGSSARSAACRGRTPSGCPNARRRSRAAAGRAGRRRRRSARGPRR